MPTISNTVPPAAVVIGPTSELTPDEFEKIKAVAELGSSFTNTALEASVSAVICVKPVLLKFPLVLTVES